MRYPLRNSQFLLHLSVLALLVFLPRTLPASAMDDSWPTFAKQGATPGAGTTGKPQRHSRKRRRKHTTKSVRGKRKLRSRRRIRRKNRSLAKKQGISQKSRMTNHEAESQRKHRVITAKTFEYPDLMTDAAKKGEALFNENCIACHGKNALGAEYGPPLLHDYYRPGHHNDVAIYAAPLYGVEQHHWKFGNMPKIEAVTKADVHNLIIYIRTLQRANSIY